MNGHPPSPTYSSSGSTSYDDSEMEVEDEEENIPLDAEAVATRSFERTQSAPPSIFYNAASSSNRPMASGSSGYASIGSVAQPRQEEPFFVVDGSGPDPNPFSGANLHYQEPEENLHRRSFRRQSPVVLEDFDNGNGNDLPLLPECAEYNLNNDMEMAQQFQNGQNGQNAQNGLAQANNIPPVAANVPLAEPVPIPAQALMVPLVLVPADYVCYSPAQFRTLFVLLAEGYCKHDDTPNVQHRQLFYGSLLPGMQSVPIYLNECIHMTTFRLALQQMLDDMFPNGLN